MQREYAYAKRGMKVIGHISGKKYKRVNIVAAKLNSQIIAPLQYSGTMDSELFEFWFKNCLIPILPCNLTIVMDNATFHKKSSLFLLAEKYGHNIIFLPPYSPELNPIETFWASLKTNLKKILPLFSNFNDALRFCFTPN